MESKICTKCKIEKHIVKIFRKNIEKVKIVILNVE